MVGYWCHKVRRRAHGKAIRSVVRRLRLLSMLQRASNAQASLYLSEQRRELSKASEISATTNIRTVSLEAKLIDCLWLAWSEM